MKEIRYTEGLTHIMISLDAATPETYSVIRVGGDYEKVVKNIENFVKWEMSV